MVLLMGRRLLRGLGCTMATAGLLLAATPPAPAADAVEVPVPNGTFASPVAPDNGTQAGHAGWSPDNTGVVFGKGLAQHPLGYQAAALNWNGAALTLRTRLWGVKAGSHTTLTWDDSPGVHRQCKPEQVKDGQRYNVALITAGPAPDPEVTTKGTDTVGVANWTTGRTFEFTATEDNPMVSFESAEQRDSLSCGPLITNVTARQTPAPVDQRIRKEQLPAPMAYRGNDPLEPGIAVDDCEGSAGTCVFTVDSRSSYRYYGPARIVGEVYLNCTRNPVVDDHRVRATELPYDNLTQYYALKGAPLVPSRSDISQSRPNLAGQVAAGFSVAGGNDAAVSSSTPLTWSRTTDKNLNPTIQPGEMSWIEVQPARERVVGTFTNSRNAYRLDALFDVPSSALPDRYYQRTGPLTEAELKRCGSARPTAGTPENGTGADTRLLTLDAPPEGAGTTVTALDR
ncbi:hypothetical protein [Kitasatospora sp. NPDC094015]|uniref:hypothetical protein n=1 Tax=Kitasatospora sp. NPDC094015 TaxID=3155205 RepID=UPI00331AE674